MRFLTDKYDFELCPARQVHCMLCYDDSDCASVSLTFNLNFRFDSFGLGLKFDPVNNQEYLQILIFICHVYPDRIYIMNDE